MRFGRRADKPSWDVPYPMSYEALAACSRLACAVSVACMRADSPAEILLAEMADDALHHLNFEWHPQVRKAMDR